jgi:soluble lytic murein transglycosylase-like protein
VARPAVSRALPLAACRAARGGQAGGTPGDAGGITPAGPATTGGVQPAGKTPAGMPADKWTDCVDAGKKTGVDPYVLAAQMEKESQFGKALGGSPSGGDGLMQVEPSTRAAYAGKFQAKMGHAYDHSSQKDQVAMAGVILADKGGSSTNMLQKYNGGDNWTPGTADSYGRPIKADEYAASVVARAEQMKNGG